MERRAWRNFRRRRCCALCPGYEFASPGKRSATGGDIPPQQKNPAPFGTGFFLNAKQKARSFDRAFCLFDAWQFPTLTWGDPTLPSALRRFTSEFGMGSGGPTALVPPGKFFVLVLVFCAHTALAALASVSHILLCMLLPSRRFAALSPAQNLSDS